MIALLGALPRLFFTLVGDALTAWLSPLYAAGPVAGVQETKEPVILGSMKAPVTGSSTRRRRP